MKILNEVASLEKRGCPILGITYTDNEGVTTKRDIQIGVNLNFTGHVKWGVPLSKATLEHKGKYYVRAVDRNAALRKRKENPLLGVKEAARESFRTFRADRILEIRYGNRILAHV